MVQYDFPTLFADHNVVSIVIVNSTATVTPVANDEPEIEDADFILTEDDLDQESLELSESLNSSKNLKFGSMEASCLQFDVFNSPNLQNLKDVEIAVYLYFEEDSSSLFQVGIYLVNADKYEDDRSTRHITAYDLNFFLRDYDITDWYNDIYKTTAYWDIKHLRDDLFAWLAQEEPDLTIVQQVTTLVNDDFELEKGIESDVVTFGFFMSGILEANGVFGHVGRDGTYNYVALESYDKPAKLTITEDISLEPTQYENYHVWGIGYVAIYDRNNIRLAKEGTSAYKHPSIYNIVNSFVFSNTSNRAGWKEAVQQAAQNLRDMITHMWYYPIENECEGNLCYEVGDRIDLVLEDYDEETEGVDDEVPIITNLYSYILQRQFTGIQEFSDLITAKGDRKQPKYKVKNDRWHPGDSDKSTSGSGSGGVSYVDSEHDRRLMQLLRNRGDRFLDEPSNVSVVYDRQNVEVAIKWTDPPNINTQQPHECEWAGTCVIRKEDSAPLHRWDGTLIVKSTTRDQYEVSAYVDDTVELNKKYYYAIMPYYIALDDSSNSIARYTWTKVVSVNTSVSMMAPLITGLQVYDVNVIATFEIPTLESGSYSYIKIVAKKGSIPTSKTDGIVKDLQASDTGVQFTGLDPESRYYFVIFASDGVTEVTSDPEDCRTAIGTKFTITSIASSGTSFIVNYRIDDYSTIGNYSEIKIVAKANGIPANKNDGYVIDITNNFYASQDSSWNNVDNEVAFIGLSNAESYGFKIFADNDISNSMVKAVTAHVSPYSMDALIWFSGAGDVGRPEQDRHYGYIPCYLATPVSRIDYQVGIWTDEPSKKTGKFYIRDTKSGENLVSQQFEGYRSESPKTFTCQLSEAMNGLKWLVFNDPANSGWNPAVLKLTFYTE